MPGFGAEVTPISQLTTKAALLERLSLLATEEAQLDAHLTSLISSRSKLEYQLTRLEGWKSAVGGIEREASEMCREVGEVALTAERVGGKVRVLDEEQSRVKASIEVVQAVQDLKSSIASLDLAMRKEDWEEATRHIQRASAIDPEIVSSAFADSVVPTPNLPLPPPQTLQTLRASLLDTFLTSFRKASTSGDVQNTNRFFKLFPMIGEEEVGLNVYAEWVGGIVRNKTGALSAKSQSPTHFSMLLTTLFESIALIISQHQPVVEKNYGPNKMLAVAQSLMTECDRLGMRVISNWEEERRIDKKLTETGEWKFTFLQTLVPSASSRSKPGMGRNFETLAISSIGDENAIDTRDVDAVLAELSMMSGRWELLRRFLYGRLSENEDEEVIERRQRIDSDESPLETPGGVGLTTVVAKTTVEEVEVETDLEMVEKSELGLKIEERLRTIFEPMEIWYLRSSIEKAHQMDEADLLSQPSMSSSLDDSFYILKKTLYRLLATASISTLVSMSKKVKHSIERDVIEVWRARMDGAFKDVANGGGVGRAREEERERREKEAKVTYIVYLNNLDIAAEYSVRLVDELLAGQTLDDAFFLPTEIDRSRIALLSIRSIEERFRSVLKTGLDHLFNQLVRPRLRPLLADVYKDVSYILDEESYAEAEYRDDVRKRFIMAWENSLSTGYRASLTPANFNLFFATAVNVLVRPWEGIVRGMKFTELGALRLDRDIRSVLSYLCAQSPFASGLIRDSFSRLQQIATLLTLESIEEAEEVLGATEGNRLTASEVGLVMGLRI